MKLVAALLVFFVGKWLSGHISRLVVKLLEKNKVELTLIHFLENLIYYTLLVLVLVAAASQLGINTASFLTIIGAAGLAAGSLRMGLLRFFLISWAGKTVRYLYVAVAGYYGLEFILKLLS